MANQTVERPSVLIRDPKYIPPYALTQIESFVQQSFHDAGRLIARPDGEDIFDMYHLKNAVELIMDLRELGVPRRKVRDAVRVICAEKFRRVPHSPRVTLAELLLGYIKKTGESTPQL